MDEAIISAILGNLDIIRELPAEKIETIAAHSQLKRLSRGEIVFDRGDVAQGLYVLSSGQIKLGITSLQGAEKVVSIINPGESFGEALLFLERRFPVYAQATMDSKVVVIAKGAIFSLLDKDPTVARKMLAGLSIRMHQLVKDIETLSLQSGTERFIGYLLQISSNQPDASKVTLPSSKATIASLLNLTPETLSRTMMKLQQYGLIEVYGKEIVIDVTGLRKFI
jgi:CRP-like cAMP-binding protein